MDDNTGEKRSDFEEGRYPFDTDPDAWIDPDEGEPEEANKVLVADAADAEAEFAPDDFDLTDWTGDEDGVEVDTPPPTPTEFLTGSAGTGKSYEINRRLSEDPSYALVAASTGIASVNLGENVTTINSALGYFDTESLVENYIKGHVVRKLKKIRGMGYRNLVWDEISMSPAKQLDTVVRALDDFNGSIREPEKRLGLVITGDFMQLPPINARWAFEADCWPRFDANTTKLTKCWRQADGPFLDALSMIRRGDGYGGAMLLDQCGVEYANDNDLDFDGTTIMSKNDEVDRFNWAAHNRLSGKMTIAKSKRWGKVKSEWKLIPPTLELKIGAYVMILANAKANAMSSELLYANGDCGTVEAFHPGMQAYKVKLKRNGKTVVVAQITRRNEQKERPSAEEMSWATTGTSAPYYDDEKRRWVIGEVTYTPLRLAYASTVHKVQGVTLDAVQINLTNAFFGQPAMAYVALSRCRSAEGLRIVGSRELLAKRVCTDPRVLKFL